MSAWNIATVAVLVLSIGAAILIAGWWRVPKYQMRPLILKNDKDMARKQDGKLRKTAGNPDQPDLEE